MTFLAKLKDLFGLHPRAELPRKHPLREFVYLDETSVQSLLASRVGAISEEFLESHETRRGSSLSGRASAGWDKVLAGEAAGALTDEYAAGIATTRRAVVQAKFKTLREELDSELVLKTSHSGSPIHDGRLVNPNLLQRGAPLELELDVEADPVYSMGEVVSAVVSLVEHDLGLFGVDSDDFRNVLAFQHVLKGLMAGLIPLRGICRDWVVVEHEGADWLCPISLAKNYGSQRELAVSCIAAVPSFWRDHRRVVFSNSRFRVLCRMASDGLRTDAAHIPLFQILESVVPNFKDQVEAVNTTVHRTLRDARNPRQDDRVRSEVVLTHYARLLVERHQIVIDELTQRRLAEVAAIPWNVDWESVEERRPAFNSIADALTGEGYKLDQFVVSELRKTAVDDCYRSTDGAPRSPIEGTAAERRFLEIELVAMYW